MNLGNWQLDTVSGGPLRLDGGAMFGVVPRAVWERKTTPDDQNRVQLATNCVLARDGRHTVLIDTGYGTRRTEREQSDFAIPSGDHLIESLSRLNVSVEDVDTVVFSHLHFDHVGGGARLDDGRHSMLTFPKATYVTGQIEWEDATSNTVEIAGAYPADNILPLKQAKQLKLLGDGQQIVPGMQALHTGGHTRGHQAIVIESGGHTAIYLGDFCPTHVHMRMLWVLGFDTYPIDTRRRKPEVLGKAADAGWLVLWDHDPTMVAARIQHHPKQQFVVVEEFPSLTE